MFMVILKRELKIAFRKGSELVNPLWFFLIVITLFPLSVGVDPGLLSRLAPGIIWVAALLACLLSLERLFRDDYLDGSLEQLMLLPEPLPLVVFAKAIAHWLLTAVPLLLLSPVLAVLLSLDFVIWLGIALTLLLGTPTLILIGAIGVALTVGLKKGGVLLSVLVLPLYIPVLIFSTTLIDVLAMGADISGLVAVLAAMMTGTISLAPFVIAACLRITIH